MIVSDYIVEFLIKNIVTDVFGYPGGMVTQLMDSLDKYKDKIHQHVCFNEQAGAFEACGYAQSSGKLGVAFATSGPGATNLITGICDAWFDSIPVLFITGQVNTNEMKNHMKIRQRGFQETDIVTMVSSVTKYAKTLKKTADVPSALKKAVYTAFSGRKGPVLLDIPMDVMKSEINGTLENESIQTSIGLERVYDCIGSLDVISRKLAEAKRPCILAGSGIKQSASVPEFRKVVSNLHIPVVTSMTAVDILDSEDTYNYGFIGAYGDRCANFIIAKSDLIITMGARLDVRQVGAIRSDFAKEASVIRIDIDQNELDYKVHNNEIDIHCDLKVLLNGIRKISSVDVWSEWIAICARIRESLKNMDRQTSTGMVGLISTKIPDNVTITTDVGQNQVWIAQAFHIKKGQRILFSGGHGAMGCSLPAAIGAYYALHRPVMAFMGDGGLQMNIQELEFLQRDRIPVKVIVLNNHALGMIRHFQEMYFDSNYVDTTIDSGYAVPDLQEIARAYSLEYHFAENNDEITAEWFTSMNPAIIEISLPDNTYVYPKLRFGMPNQDQEPLISREIYNEIMEL